MVFSSINYLNRTTQYLKLFNVMPCITLKAVDRGFVPILNSILNLNYSVNHYMFLIQISASSIHAFEFYIDKKKCAMEGISSKV